MTIEIESLSKYYGNKIAVDNVSLSIGKGIFGLIGRNGAGKTTLLRILATLLPKSDGEVIINGIPIKKAKEIRRIIGYMPQEFSFYPGLNVWETMKYFCALSDVSEKYDKRITETLSRVHLMDQIKTKVHKLSGGMKRRLGMAVAMIADPSILLIDEPTVGLDPEERIHFRRMISDFAEDKIVLLSSHIIEDVEQICDRIAIMQDGAIVWTGLVGDVKKEMEGMVWEGYSNSDNIEDYSELSDSSILLSKIRKDDKYFLRVISKQKPFTDAILTFPCLEDAYVWKCFSNRLLVAKEKERI